MNVLILTGKFGMGHVSAADSLKEEILEKYPKCNVVMEDIIDYVLPQQAEMVYKSFGFMAKKGSLLYNSIYKQSEEKGCKEPPLVYSYFIKKLSVLVEDVKPDVIFSTLPFCSQVLAKQKRKTGGAWKLVTCITDITSHGEWINDEVDFYMVAAQPVKRELMRKGVLPEKILVSGIPVKGAFRRERYDTVEDGKKKVLIMGGGLGLLPASQSFYDGLARIEQTEFTVITGKNEKLRSSISGKYENIKVLGYTEQVADYMKAADAVVTKPGGITVFEAIESETPLLLFTPFLQQEKTNSAFVEQTGIGCVLEKAESDMLKQLESVLGKSEFKEYGKNMKQLKKDIHAEGIQWIFREVGA